MSEYFEECVSLRYRAAAYIEGFLERRGITLDTTYPTRMRSKFAGLRRCVALCLIAADVQHQGEADLFPGKGGELWASLWQEA